MISFKKALGNKNAGSNTGKNIKFEVEFELARQVINDIELLISIDSMNL